MSRRYRSTSRIETFEPLLLMSASGIEVEGDPGDVNQVVGDAVDTNEGGVPVDLLTDTQSGSDFDIAAASGLTVAEEHSINRAPIIRVNPHVSMLENTTFVVDVDAEDPEGDDLIFSIAKDRNGRPILHGDQFEIDPVSGVLTAKEPFDFEATSGRTVFVNVSDGVNISQKAIWVSIVNVPEPVENNNAPQLIAVPEAIIEIDEHRRGIIDASAFDPDGDRLEYTLLGEDADQAIIDRVTGMLSFRFFRSSQPVDADGDGIFDFVIRVSDGQLSDDAPISVRQVPATPNLRPVISGIVANQVFTINSNETLEIPFDVFDADDDDEVSVVVLSDRVASPGFDTRNIFQVDYANSSIVLVHPLDALQPIDQNRDNVYYVSLSASDGIQRTFVGFQVVVTAPDGANARVPQFQGLPDDGVLTVLERQSTIADLNTDTSTGDFFHIVGGADRDLFGIDPVTGELRFENGLRLPRGTREVANGPEFEFNQDNEYDVVVRATSAGGYADAELTVRIQDFDETVNQSPVFTGLQFPSVLSDSARVFYEPDTHQVVDFDAIDPDGQSIVTYHLAGKDAHIFRIDERTGVLSQDAALDDDGREILNRFGRFRVTVIASDGLSVTEQQVDLVTRPETDVPLDFRYSDSFRIQPVDEGQLGLTSPVVINANGNPVTFTISDGEDAARFSIDEQTGAVTFLSSPDFDNPLDADGDNDYEIFVRISDEVRSTERPLTIRVLPNASPLPDPDIPDTVTELQFTNLPDDGRILIQEGGTLAADLNAVSPGNGPVTYELFGGADGWQFDLNAETGALHFFDARNFESPTDIDRNNVYDVNVRISDGDSSLVRSLSIRVSDEPEGNLEPLFFTNVGNVSTVSVLEDRNRIIRLEATDRVVDAAGVSDRQALSYRITGGADADLFILDSESGQLSFLNPADYEAPGDEDGDNRYQVNVSVTNGLKTATSQLTVRVENTADPDTNDLPVIPQLNDDPVVYVKENETFVGEFTGQDPENDDLIYTLVTGHAGAGEDIWLFTIDRQTGRVEFVDPPSADRPVDTDGDNVYQLTVRAYDGRNFRDHDLRVRVIK